VLTLLSTPPEHRDPDLADELFDAMTAHAPHGGWGSVDWGKRRIKAARGWRGLGVMLIMAAEFMARRACRPDVE
jgi:hypothetical protein